MESAGVLAVVIIGCRHHNLSPTIGEYLLVLLAILVLLGTLGQSGALGNTWADVARCWFQWEFR